MLGAYCGDYMPATRHLDETLDWRDEGCARLQYSEDFPVEAIAALHFS